MKIIGNSRTIRFKLGCRFVQVTNALLISLFAAVFVSSVISQDLDGFAEGTVTRADNGDPISNVRVAFGRFIGMTDSDGHFAISSISPGTYEVSISRDGYVVPGRVDLNVTITPIPLIGSVTVSPNQQIRNFHVEMQPTSTISGRVFSAGGSPATDVQLQLFWVTYPDGRLRLAPVRGSNLWSPSDDRGEFRLFGIPSGEYYLLGIPPVKAIHASGLEPVATYYSAAEIMEKAVPIRILPGEEANGIDISLLERQTTSISVNAVAPSSAVAPGFVEAVLISADSRETPGGLGSCVVVKCGFGSGHFTLRNVPRGHYSLFVMQTAKDSDYFGEAEVQVGSEATVNLTIFLHAGVNVTGHVTVIGDATAPKLTSAPISLRSTTNVTYDSGTRANRVQQNDIAQRMSQLSGNGIEFADKLAAELAALDSQGARRLNVVNENVPGPDSSGRFTIRGLPQGHYSITPSLPAGTFIMDVRQKDKSILETGLIIGDQPPAPLEIIVSASAGATVTGTVRNGNQLGIGFARVILVPDSDRQNLSRYLSTIADYAGHFTIGNVAPGDYKLFSWVNVPPGAWMNVEYMQKYEPLGTTLHVRENETPADVTLQIIPSE